MRRCLVLSCLLLSPSWFAMNAQPVASGTVPFVLDGNRIYAQVEFVRPSGTPRSALVFVDLGSPTMILSAELLNDLHPVPEKPLELRIGRFAVAVDSATVTANSWLPFPIGGSRKVEGLLPAGVMRKYQVRFDYQARTMTFALPGTLEPEGVGIPVRVNENTGLIAVEATIDGQAYPITIDNGSGYTWIRKSVAQAWLTRHPDWERGIGAVGASNMRMEDDGIETASTIVRLGELNLGTLRLPDAGVLAIPPDRSGHDFMDWYSTKNVTPVIGWIGGNVLRSFRLTIDYPNRRSDWLRQTVSDAHDLDSAGLSLIFKSGEYFVGAVVTQNGKPVVAGVQPGDKLTQIGSLRTRGASREAIFTAMHGKPGELRSLTVERDGKKLRFDTKVTAF